jgi:polyisoprenoid-binding protein YceI
MKKRFLISGMLALILCVSSVKADLSNYSIVGGKDYNKVLFISEATIESFEGETNMVEGAISFDPQNPAAGASVDLSVDLLSLDTGLSMRNSHMRDNHLHTEKFPKTYFRLEKLLAAEGLTFATGQAVPVKVQAEFDLHGVHQSRVFDATLTFYDSLAGTPIKGDGSGAFRIQCDFNVSLEDHEIPLPGFLFMKVSDTIELNIDLWAVRK